MYQLDALIGLEPVVRSAAAELKTATVFVLREGMALVPLTDEVFFELRQGDETASATTEYPAAGRLRLPAAMISWIARASRKGTVAYVSAFYFGGEGSQTAIAWKDGRVVLRPETTGDAVSQVLRLMGVSAMTGWDEWDTVGLGHFRKTERWVEHASESGRLPPLPPILPIPYCRFAAQTAGTRVAPGRPFWWWHWWWLRNTWARAGWWIRQGRALLRRLVGAPALRERWKTLAISETRTRLTPQGDQVLEVDVIGSQSQEVYEEACRFLKEEIARRRPEYLVANLLGFEPPFDAHLLGFLVGAFASMSRIGQKDNLRIVVAGKAASELEKVLRITKLASVFGSTYPDLEAALASMPRCVKQASPESH